jgi:hypothetical protein
MPKTPPPLATCFIDPIATTNVFDGELVLMTSFINVDGADAVAKKRPSIKHGGEKIKKGGHVSKGAKRMCGCCLYS